MARVLLAADEPALLDILADVLQDAGHEVTRAHDGLEALEAVRSARPDVVVTDHMMPRKSGVELTRELRRDPALADVPVILMSAARPREEERGAATRFLAKPFTPADLEEAVREALGGQVKPAPAAASAAVSSLREQMLSWVSHEIKTPLSAATAAVHLAQRALRADDRDGVTKRLDVIGRQLRRMDELVTSILDAAQLEQGKLQLQLEEVDVAALAATVVAFWRELHPDYEFEVSGEAALTLRADGERVRQVLENLVSNAVKYGGAARRVVVHLAATPSAVSVSVADAGQGIPSEELESIFDRFHRVAGQSGRGHGLGLFIASALARLHGGTLAVESQVGAGSRFTLTLPRG
jgi:signal transduction histidine kinase